MTFDALKSRWRWHPIAHCPGRFVLADAEPPLSFGELVGPGIRVCEYRVERAPDPVAVVALADGGLISYRKRDGRYLHTLNTAEGFARKLAQLGIAPP